MGDLQKKLNKLAIYQGNDATYTTACGSGRMKQAIEDVERMLNADRLEEAASDLKSSSSLNQAAHELKVSS